MSPVSAKTKRGSVLLRVLIVAFCVYMFATLGTLIAELSSKQEQLAEYEEQKKQTSLRIEEKENLLKNSTIEEIIERAARESLGYGYPNELVFIDVN